MKILTHTLIFATLFLASLLLCISCSTAVSVVAKQDMSGSVRLQTEVSESVQSIMENFFGTDTSGTLFDEAQIRSSLKKSNLSVTKLSFPTSASIDLTAGSADLQKILPDANDFLTVTDKKGSKELTIKLTPENIQKAVALMPEDASVYIDLLIAPVFTGEQMTRTEYIEMISIAYGDDVVADLRKAAVKLNFTIPGKVVSSSLSNGKMGSIEVSNNTAVLTMPLLNLLTDTNGTECTINWIE